MIAAVSCRQRGWAEDLVLALLCPLTAAYHRVLAIGRPVTDE